MQYIFCVVLGHLLPVHIWYLCIVQDVRKAYQRAMDSMARLNRTASRLMHKVRIYVVPSTTLCPADRY